MATATWRPADTLASRLIQIRHELGISQREASLRTGVPFGTWQGMELGRDTRGLDRHVLAIVDALGVDRDWLMWGSSSGRTAWYGRTADIPRQSSGERPAA